jgi:pyruvate/2-oxoglutarate dehydrogenase complex dihydrolipoamide acyltransferase (E2) component
MSRWSRSILTIWRTKFRAPVTGVLAKVFVKDGGYVEPGTVVGTIDQVWPGWSRSRCSISPLAAAKPNMKQSQPLKGFWIILALAVMIGFSAVVVGSTLEAPPSADDKRIFFVIGAGLLAIVLFLIAEAWRFLAIKRRGDWYGRPPSGGSQRTALCKRTGNFQHPDPPWQSRRAIIFRSAALLSHEVVEHAEPSGNTSTATW